MNIKAEFTESLHDDVESGQCSDEEFEVIKKEKKSKKHKRRDKTRKSRKRKHSSSESETSYSEFFNPYTVPPMKFNIKEECDQIFEESNNASNICEVGDINETMEFQPFIDQNEDQNVIMYDNNADLNLTSKSQINESDNGASENDFRLRPYIEPKYVIDTSGIDTVTSDLFHFLMDLGLSHGLVNDILQVFSKEDNNEDMLSNHDDQDGYEEEMINEIPIIDQPMQSVESGGYSPEHASNLIEPYQPQQRPNIAYAPAVPNHNIHHSNHIIDPLSIPAVGPRDPRLNQTKTLLQMKPVSITKPIEVVNEIDVPKIETSPVITKEWEMTVLNVVKTHLRLYLIHNDINKEEYKSILKRAVSKILTSGEKKLETDKISKFLHSYVMVTQKSRINNI